MRVIHEWIRNLYIYIYTHLYLHIKSYVYLIYRIMCINKYIYVHTMHHSFIISSSSSTKTISSLCTWAVHYASDHRLKPHKYTKYATGHRAFQLTDMPQWSPQFFLFRLWAGWSWVPACADPQSTWTTSGEVSSEAVWEGCNELHYI